MTDKYALDLLAAMNAADNCLISMIETANEYIEDNGHNAELADTYSSIRAAAEQAQIVLFTARDDVRAIINKLGYKIVGSCGVDH
jgi:hypothetical protein